MTWAFKSNIVVRMKFVKKFLQTKAFYPFISKYYKSVCLNVSFFLLCIHVSFVDKFL